MLKFCNPQTTIRQPHAHYAQPRNRIIGSYELYRTDWDQIDEWLEDEIQKNTIELTRTSRPSGPVGRAWRLIQAGCKPHEKKLL